MATNLIKWDYVKCSQAEKNEHKYYTVCKAYIYNMHIKVECMKDS